MKKYFLLVALVLGATTMSAQTYEVIARSNDTIKLYPNALGAAIKSIVPGTSAAEPDYRMIKKTKDGKESILFVEFINIADKFLVTYETDLVTAGKFNTKIHSLVEVFKATQRVNAIYLEGEYLGMKIQVYQRPANFKDIFIIDGINLQLPVKIIEIDALVKAAQQKQEARLKKAASLNISAETLADAEDYKCEYYIAYLVRTSMFNAKLVQEVNELYDQQKITNLIKTFNTDQLSFIVKDVDAQKECGKYSL